MKSADSGRELLITEEPVYISQGSDILFGVFTTPIARSRTPAISLLPGAGVVTSTHRNGMFVRLTRDLATNGWCSLKVDYRGVGESAGATEFFSLDEPHTYAVEAALQWYAERGVDEHILVGTCFGARTLLAYSDRVPGLRGLAMVSPPVEDFPTAGLNPSDSGGQKRKWALFGLIGRLVEIAWEARHRHKRHHYWLWLVNWIQVRVRALAQALGSRRRPHLDSVSPNFLLALQELARRDVPVLLLYGSDDIEYANFEGAMRGRLGKLVDGSTSIQLRVSEGKIHGFERLAAQETVIRVVQDWIGGLELDSIDQAGSSQSGQAESADATSIETTDA
jgi:pimeloyl-ACP methyl ester carboxylesterase